ncbi:peptidase M48, partial [filamentous cyanobacterium CCP2]
YAHELSLDEFVHQSDRYQNLDQDGLNQIYKFFLYNNLAQGTFLSHPFTVERVKFLKDWANSDHYRQIRTGNYRRTGEGAVEVPSEPPPPEPTTRPTEVERLQREIADLQRAIDEIKRSQSE